MRTFSLFLIAVAIVFGIPRLVNEYRAPRLDENVPPAMAASQGAVTHKIENLAAINAGALPGMTSAVLAEKLAAVQLVPVSLRPAEASAVPAIQVPAIPAKELISAIQKELSRLGYYGGPGNGKWSKAVRAGARKFIRRSGGHERYQLPSLELLASLKAANVVKPEAKPDKGPALDLRLIRQAEDPRPIRQAELHPKESPLQESAAVAEAVPGDDYLPPWMKRSDSAAKREASSAANNATPPAVSNITGQVRHKRHRREREWDVFAF